jgi:A/G-specific adenine glycosylase
VGATLAHPSATAAASAADVAPGANWDIEARQRLHECATVIADDHGDVVPDDIGS